MKRETFRHPKTYDLAARLNISRPHALGLLQLLWDWTAEVAIGGDVGRWPNGAIARACDWPDDPDRFVAALVDSRWLDVDDTYRLIIHDWAQHCENWVRAKAQKLGVKLLGSKLLASQEAVLSPTLKSDSFPCDQTNPIRTKPNLSPPPPATGSKNWEEVEKELAKLGVAKKREAWHVAAKNGCTPEQVLGWIAWLNSRPGQYTNPAGVLYHRMTSPDAAAWDVEENWPPLKSQTQNAPQAKQLPQRDQKELEELDRIYGEQLDSMSHAEVCTVIEDEDERTLLRSFDKVGLTEGNRLAVLRLLKRRDPESLHSIFKRQETSSKNTAAVPA